MQLNRKIYEPLKGATALLALAILLGGCGSGQGQQAGSPPVPEVATVTIQPQPVELTTPRSHHSFDQAERAVSGGNVI